MILWLAAAAHGAWVLAADTDRVLRRALRAIDRADREQGVVLDPFTVCVVPTDPTDRLERRVERRLGHPLEDRLDCDVAWYPLGRGWVAMVVEQPAEGLEAALDEARLAYVEVTRPSDPAQPVRVCLARGSVAEPMDLARRLEAAGQGIRSVYEVGACVRR